MPGTPSTTAIRHANLEEHGARGSLELHKQRGSRAIVVGMELVVLMECGGSKGSHRKCKSVTLTFRLIQREYTPSFLSELRD
jgi:hypothetical protein